MSRALGAGSVRVAHSIGGEEMPVPVATETARVHGARVVVVDGDRLLAGTANGRVHLLRDASYPAPVREVRVWLDRVGTQLELAADIRTGGLPPAHVIIGGALLVPAGLVGALLARRLLRTERPAVTGTGGTATLPATISYDGSRTVQVRARVPEAAATGDHLRDLVVTVLGVVGELAGGAEPLRGRTYVVGGGSVPRRRPVRADDVRLDQVGGLSDVVDQFREIAVSFLHPEIMARWGARRPQGILLYGPPGTGKTMLARALANEIGATLREIRTPDILDKWLGGSERNIRQIFQEARRYRQPTVMLFDEFDSIISYAGAGGDAASQAVNAVAGIFKQEMNGLIEANPNVIVVATTNFPHRVDESLTRSGRFDVKLSIPLPGEAGRAEILTKAIRELIDRYEVGGFRMFADDLDIGALAAGCPGMSGADLTEALRRVRLAKAMQEARTGRSEPIGHDDLAATLAALRR